MREQRIRIAVAAGLALLLGAPQAEALQKCAAKIDAKDGRIVVSARNVNGPLLWGWTDTTQIQPFFNAATCMASGKAKDCRQGAAGTLLAITPPPDCTLYLADGFETCTAFLKKCTPGKRPRVELPARFIDNGDGTVTDTHTGLMWEKKTDDGSIHDKDNTYAWSTGAPGHPNGPVFFTFLATLNGPTPFAGYGDWRLPKYRELESIADFTQGMCGGGSGPCIDQAVFGPTSTSDYWSATNYPSDHLEFAYHYGFSTGGTGAAPKISTLRVRAVRSVR